MHPTRRRELQDAAMSEEMKGDKKHVIIINVMQSFSFKTHSTGTRFFLIGETKEKKASIVSEKGEKGHI